MRVVELNNNGEWLLFRALVCDAIVKDAYAATVISDPWDFSGALDMSFEDIRKHDLKAWPTYIARELKSFVECDKEMFKKH